MPDKQIITQDNILGRQIITDTVRSSQNKQYPNCFLFSF